MLQKSFSWLFTCLSAQRVCVLKHCGTSRQRMIVTERQNRHRNGQESTQKWSRIDTEMVTEMVKNRHRNGQEQTQKWSRIDTEMVKNQHRNGHWLLLQKLNCIMYYSVFKLFFVPLLSSQNGEQDWSYLREDCHVKFQVIWQHFMLKETTPHWLIFLYIYFHVTSDVLYFSDMSASCLKPTRNRFDPCQTRKTEKRLKV